MRLFFIEIIEILDEMRWVESTIDPQFMPLQYNNIAEYVIPQQLRYNSYSRPMQIPTKSHF